MTALCNATPARLPFQSLGRTTYLRGHRDAKNRLRAATGARLHALAELVKFVFDVAILRELGFSQSEIVRLFNRNHRLTSFVNLMLRYMAETKPGR